MKAEIYLLIFFIVVVIGAIIARNKFKDKLSKPNTQKIFGYILIICSVLAFILNLIANLLESKVITSSFILQAIGSVCFLILGIILIKKSKEKN